MICRVPQYKKKQRKTARRRVFLNVLYLQTPTHRTPRAETRFFLLYQHHVQGTMTDDAIISVIPGVRNINVQAEMSGNAKITVVGEVSGSITVASMSGNAKIEAGSCAKPTTKTGTITGSAAITGTGC